MLSMCKTEYTEGGAKLHPPSPPIDRVKIDLTKEYFEKKNLEKLKRFKKTLL